MEFRCPNLIYTFLNPEGLIEQFVGRLDVRNHRLGKENMGYRIMEQRLALELDMKE